MLFEKYWQLFFFMIEDYFKFYLYYKLIKFIPIIDYNANNTTGGGFS